MAMSASESGNSWNISIS